jgi:hypothetical protein
LSNTRRAELIKLTLPGTVICCRTTAAISTEWIAGTAGISIWVIQIRAFANALPAEVGALTIPAISIGRTIATASTVNIALKTLAIDSNGQCWAV